MQVGKRSTFRHFYDKPIYKTFGLGSVTCYVCPNLAEIFTIYYAYIWKIFSVFSNHINVG